MSNFLVGMMVNTFKQSPQVSWFTPPGLGVKNGYGYAAVETIRALQSKGVAVPYQANSSEFNRSSDAYCHISYIQPPFYQGLHDQYRIGYTCWESTEIPEEWIPKMRAMNEIWTPCTFIENVYKKYEVNTTIRYVPHGFDPEIWKIVQRYEKDTITFLHVGGPTARKGGQRVVDAFLDLFDGNKKAKLILKTHGSTEARCYVDGVFGSAARHPQITQVTDSLDTYELADLYASADCLVYPTNGEGFGLIPFQGIASGLPTIVTDATACSDFAHLAIPLRASEVPGEGVHLGTWYEPDAAHLREQMTSVFENFDKHKEDAIQSARIVHQTWTWAHVADKIIDILGDKLFQRI